MNPNNFKLLRPLLLLFVLVNVFLVSGRGLLNKWGVNQEVLIIGNLVVFATVILSWIILRKAIRSSNPHAFVRAMYGSFIIKFFVLAVASFIYIMMTKQNVNKAALFGCIGLYFIYTFVEISSLLKLLKQEKNAQERSSH